MSTFRHMDPAALRELRKSTSTPMDPGDAYVVRELTTMSVGFMQDPGSFVAAKMAPSIQVAQQAGIYMQWPRGSMFRDEMKPRVDGAESAGGALQIDNSPKFYADVYAYHVDLGSQLRANAITVNMDQAGTLACTQKALIKRERLWMNAFFKTGVWTKDLQLKTSGGGGVAGVDLSWADANALPIKQIKALIRNSQSSTGKKFNKATFSTDAFDALCEHPSLIGRVDRGQTAGAAEVNQQIIAQLCGLKEVCVAESIYTTSKEGQTDALGFIAPTAQVLLAYVEENPGVYTASAMYSFDWVPPGGQVGGFGNAVSRWYSQDRKATRYEIEMATDQHLIAADLGALMYNVLA